MRLVIICIFILSVYTVNGQFFEGSLTYQISCKNCKTESDSIAVENMTGKYQMYYYKENNYLSEFSKGMLSKQIYLANTNFLYYKLSNGKIMEQNASICNDSVINFTISNTKRVIAGLACKQLILRYISGDSTVYYFNSSLKIDFKKFNDHCFGNWSKYTAIAKALPLSYSINIGKYSIEVACIQIKRKKIPNSLFKL